MNISRGCDTVGRKFLYFILTVALCIFVSGCGSGKETLNDVAAAGDEDTEARTGKSDIVITDEQETDVMTEQPIVVAEVSNYSVMKFAGASRELFLEEDISALIKQAKAGQINETPADTEASIEAAETEDIKEELTGEENTGEEETEETEGVEHNEGEIQETTGETVTADTPQRATGGGRVVCIDAGHQIKQNSEKEPIGPGASETKIKVSSGTSGTTTGVPEYQLTLAVALKLQSVLESRGYKVIMCRSSHDVNISNAERASIANNAGAGAFIRIHADGAASASASGASTLAPSGSNPYCASIASSSQSLANSVINAYCAKTGMRNRGVQITDSMTGLNWSQVPVTIIEMGFMTNPGDDQTMQTESFQQAAAEGMADGIDAFFGQ